MSRRNNRQKRDKKGKRGRVDEAIQNEELISDFQVRRSHERLEAKTVNQGQYISSMTCNTVTFGIGPAGTGKTYCAAAYAAELLEDRQIEKIYITRPAVESGESLGFLPGELEDKFDPYLEPFLDVLNEKLGKSHVKALMKAGRIVASPLAYMRGKTFKDSIVILDEAQNTTPTQMKMFLTRFGDGARVIVNGDIKQCDLKGIQSGLQDAVERLGSIKGIGVVEFDKDDIVRHGLIRHIIDRYEK